ncbi:hypothetical protein Nepgr_006736 [Nepenthes gracilis]|uniref:Uncharacterized protein n=1 Tax=Nepenthes gracilis TaxID=150966 RepID=A0AAD3S644_NEPGR|nr:hypothetical protein Nepgr_006736 [Nepenthes gracilis]
MRLLRLLHSKIAVNNNNATITTDNTSQHLRNKPPLLNNKAKMQPPLSHVAKATPRQIDHLDHQKQDSLTPFSCPNKTSCDYQSIVTIFQRKISISSDLPSQLVNNPNATEQEAFKRTSCYASHHPVPHMPNLHPTFRRCTSFKE